MSLSISTSLSQISQDISGNYSVVRQTITARWTYGTWQASGASVKFTVDGSSYTQSTGINTGRATSGSQSWTHDFTVGHNDDGTKTVSASASLSYWDGTRTASASMNLSTIPRATEPTLSESSVNYGGLVTVNLPRKSSSFTHTVQVYGGSMSGWTDIATGVGTSCTLSIPKSWANYFTGTNASLQVRAITYNGSTNIGTKYANALTLEPTSDMVPSISDVSVEEAVEAVANAFGSNYVQGLSQVTIKITAAGIYGSTISSYSASLDGITYGAQAFTSNTLKGSGDLTLDVTVTDSRGKTATASKTITVQPYQLPVVSDIDFFACDEDGTANGDGTYLSVTVTGKAYPVNGANTKTLTLKYKAASADSYTSVTVPTSSWDFSESTILANVDPTQTYILTAELKDAWSTGSRTETTGIPVISRHAGGDGLAFGMEANSSGLVSKYDASFLGRLLANGMDLSPSDEFIEKWKTKLGE